MLPESIVILHLSDLHFGEHSDNQTKRDAKETILASLLTHLSNLPSEWKPDIICITGDLAYQACSDDYQQAEAWLRSLLAKLKLTAADLIMCPGNHDVNRSKVDFRPQTHNDSDPLFLLPISETDKLHSPFEEYSNFCTRLNIPKYLCGEAESYLVGIRHHKGITFLAQNSAWFAKGDDNGELWIGLPLLRHMEVKSQIENLNGTSSDKIVVALMHHPFSWLHDAEQHQRDLRKSTAQFLCYRARILLTGHTHDPAASVSLLQECCWHFPGGATYDDERTFKSFRLIRIKPPITEELLYEYDPRSPDDSWKPKGDTQPRPLIMSKKVWNTIIQNIPTSRVAYSLIEEPGEVSASETTDSERNIESDIKRTAALIHKGQTKLAQGELSQLYNRAREQKLSGSILSRIANNLGICLMENGNLSEAREKFQEAADLNPASATMLANLANIQLKLNNIEAAGVTIQRARKILPYDMRVLNVYSDYLLQSNQKEQLKLLLPDLQDIQDESVEWQMLLAQLNLDAGNLLEAKRILRSISKDKELSSEGQEMLARVLIENIKDLGFRLIQSNHRLPEEALAEAEEAKKLLDVLIQKCHEYDPGYLKSSLFVNRAAANLLLEEWNNAIADYDRVLAIKPDNEGIRQSRCIALVSANRFDEIDEEIKDPILNLALAEFLIASELSDKAIKILDKVTVLTIDEKVRKIRLQIWAWKRLSQKDEVASAVEVLKTDYPMHVDSLCLRAEEAYESGDAATAIELLEEASECAEKTETYNAVILNLVNLLMVLGQHEKAIKILDSTDYPKHNSLYRMYVTALYFSGKADRALNIIENKIDEWKNDVEIIRIYVFILESVGDLTKAIEFAKHLILIAPKHIGYKLNLGRLLQIANDYDGAKEILDAIDIKEAVRKIEFIGPLSYQYRCLGFVDKALELMWQARERHFSDPNVHQAYIDIFLSLPADHKARRNPEKVENDTVVMFEQDGAKRTLFITDKPDTDLKRDEINIEKPMAKKLIGLKISDEAIVKDSLIEKSIVRIEAILTRYGFAFSETLNKFSTWFPDRQDIQKSNTNIVEAMEKMIKPQRSKVDTILLHYKKNELPTASLARMLKKSLPELWLDIIFSVEMKFHFCSGDIRDLNQQYKLVFTANTIIIDTAAILTISLLEIENLVRNYFKQIFVPGTVLSEIEGAIQAETIAAKSQLPATVPFSAQIRKRIDLLKRAKNFALSLESKNTPRILTERFVQLSDLLSPTATAALLLSMEKQTTLYSDDLSFRALIKNEHGVQSFCSQTLLKQLKENGTITALQYSVFIAKLLRYGYSYVNVDADDLLAVFNMNKHALTDDFNELAKGLSQPCEAKLVVETVVNFMEHLWRNEPPTTPSAEFLNVLLSQVCLVHKVSDIELILRESVESRVKDDVALYKKVSLALDSLFASLTPKDNNTTG